MEKIVKPLLYLIFIIISSGNLYSEFFDNGDSTSSEKYFLEKRPQFNAREIITGDTLNRDSTIKDAPILPGGTGQKFSALQDSAYFHALRLRIPVETRMNYNYDIFAGEIALKLQLLEDSPIKAAYENLASIPEEAFLPSKQEMVSHEYNIQMSQYVPYVRTLMPYGAKIGFDDIKAFFGLTEDVSPNINYTIDFATNVEVVVYSVNAVAVATLFDGHQPAGTYTIRWNGRDDKGRRMSSGDYIAEVRIGKYKYVRKRIVIP